MAYNKENRLRRIIEIQDMYLEMQSKGMTGRFIYENNVRPRFGISERTFYSYLAVNAKRELKELEKGTRDESKG